MKKFSAEQFLYCMLAAVFIWQASLFSVAAYGCFKLGGLRECPELGRRYENTTNVMIATVLALLTGSKLSSS